MHQSSTVLHGAKTQHVFTTRLYMIDPPQKLETNLLQLVIEVEKEQNVLLIYRVYNKIVFFKI
jgi:hypothetical protein